MSEKEIVPERLQLNTSTPRDALLELLRETSPEVFSEGRLDLSKLQAVLAEDLDGAPERYGLTWAGKRDAFRNVQVPSVATLRPQVDESVDWDKTENLIIEGDNLEVLKLLQKSYHGQVKMIYIDPPYNTGNEFIYPDNFREGLEDYLRYSGQLTEDNLAVSTNKDTSGRYHSNWLNMMYPRLFLARNLLKENGVIFVSIDDHEVHNLRLLMDEVFGEENFVDCIIWKKRYGGGAKEKYLVSVHEYVLMYSRSKSDVAEITISTSEESIDRYYKDRDENFEARGPFRTHPLEATKSMGERKNLVFGIVAPDGTEVMPKRQWLWSRDRVKEALNKGELAFLRDKSGNWSVHTKQYLKDEMGATRTSKAFSVIDDVFTQHGTNEIIDLFGDAQLFPFPKPSRLIKKLIEIGTTATDQDLILDFFAGSGSTAHATYAINSDDGGNRKFILVQLPEKTSFPAYPNIAYITRERVRRVITKLDQDGEGKLHLEDSDKGFRGLKLDSSNFKIWEPNPALNSANELMEQLTLYAGNVEPNRSDQDRLFELILKSGLPLSSRIELLPFGDRDVFSIANGKLVICLAEHLSRELLRQLFTLPATSEVESPNMVLCLDTAFDGKDALKTNAVLEAQSHGISFKTV
jgi:adenine-specific DNA-methyltransferase